MRDFSGLSISIIVAFSHNYVIGHKGVIPWSIKEDQIHFKNLTQNNVVIMGRVTFEDIVKKLNGPLPNRVNIVISSSPVMQVKSADSSVFTFPNLEDALCYCKDNFIDKKIFIAGGERLYTKSLEYLDYIEKIYATQIDLEVEGDRFFPLRNFASFDIITEEDFGLYKFITYKTKSKKRVSK